MAIDVLTKAVMRVELFHGLRPLQLSEIARHADRIVYKPGDVIVASGEEGNAAVLIVSGTAVRVKSPCNTDTPEPLPTGVLIGEMCMLVESEYTSTIVAKDTVRALRITRRSLLDVMAADPTIAEHLVAKIAGRLHAVAAELRIAHATMADGGARAAAPIALLQNPVASSPGPAALRH